ncbi:phosphoenolpyruvate carboxylase [Candidatus Gottesmanbacteria bacterium]|nr:phosphoenolpyruvate carboxylase [Candidatus Gottesmanbacteria bacterium]
MRKIPTTMATQHPDNAGKPYWYGQSYLSTSAELEECYRCFSELGIDEYNWDWEGKFVDEAVVDRLLHRYFAYFKKNNLGRDKFLTFRIPNPRVERQYRLARAFMVMITSSQLSKSLGFEKPPIFETILPLTETAEEILEIQKAFKDLIGLEHKLLKMGDSIQHIEIIPLFEQVSKIADSGKILRKYIKKHKEGFGFIPKYLRPYVARSDPALNSGLVPTIFAIKLALSSYRQIEEEFSMKLYPMLGAGSLPFRGGLSPENIQNSIDEYHGISTVTVQSAFRYDYPKSAVKKSIEILKTELPKHKAQVIDPIQINLIKKAIPIFENNYRISIEKLAPLINALSIQVARRRERMQHIGLFGYSRGIGQVSLPRAITFTAVLYSLGIPPELIGTGRGIKLAIDNGYWKEIAPFYLHLRDDLMKAGYFLNKENVKYLTEDFGGISDIYDDISFIEKTLNIELGPKTSLHFEHYDITKKIYNNIKERKKVSQLITDGGILRKSLG